MAVDFVGEEGFYHDIARERLRPYVLRKVEAPDPGENPGVRLENRPVLP